MKFSQKSGSQYLSAFNFSSLTDIVMLLLIFFLLALALFSDASALVPLAFVGMLNGMGRDRGAATHPAAPSPGFSRSGREPAGHRRPAARRSRRPPTRWTDASRTRRACGWCGSGEFAGGSPRPGSRRTSREAFRARRRGGGRSRTGSCK